MLDRDGAPLDPTEFTQSPHKCSHPRMPDQSVRAQDPDDQQLACLLRARRERPRCRTAKRDDEFSSSDMDCHATLQRGSCNGGYDITSSRAALRDFTPAYVSSGSKAVLAVMSAA